MAYLEIKNFNKSFGDINVLKGINLSVEKGEVVSIIGSSGSGKTTFLRCINFLSNADKGVMLLNGEVIFSASDSEYSDKNLRDKRLNFGLVFQSFNLFPQYNVIKNITLAPSLLINEQANEYKKELFLNRKKENEINCALIKELLSKNKNLTLEGKKDNINKVKLLKKSIKKDNKNFKNTLKKKVSEFKVNKKLEIEKEAENLLIKTGLIDKKLSYPCELSGGQCQRVAIARALALKPKILCFDEPTSALDPELTGEVLKVIKSLRDEGRTMIIVTHEMGFAKKVSDKVVYMSKGVIEEEGTPQEIFDNPRSENLKNFLSSVRNKDEA